MAAEQAVIPQESLQTATITRKITLKDVRDIADLVAKRITETGACLMLDIEPRRWFRFKQRAKNQEKFDTLVHRIREQKLNDCIESIDKAGDDADIMVGDKVITKRGDWRAKAWMVERAIAPDRFGDRQNVTAQQPSIPIADLAKALELACKRIDNSKAIDVQEVKQIEQPKND